MPTLTWGPWIGPPTPDGVHAVKAKADASCRLAVSTASNMASPVYFGPDTPSAGASIVEFNPTGLDSHTQYYCQVELAGTLTGTIGKFRTAPAELEPTNLRFIFGSCTGGTSPATYSNHVILDYIAARDPDLFLHLGDLAYFDLDTDYPTATTTNDVTLWRPMYDKVMAQSKMAALAASCPWAYMYSDHDCGPNGGDKTNVCRPASRQAYQECVPHPPLLLGETGDVAPYHEFAWGRVRFFMPDCRQERDVTTGTTVELSTRTRFGTAQLAYMKARLLAARETLLVINVESPWISKPVVSADHWGAYAYERRAFCEWLVANNLHKRVLLIGGDIHMLAADAGGHNYAESQVPYLNSAPLDRDGLNVGGPFDLGPLLPSAGQGQYMEVAITDDGGESLAWTATGYRVTP